MTQALMTTESSDAVLLACRSRCMTTAGPRAALSDLISEKPRSRVGLEKLDAHNGLVTGTLRLFLDHAGA